MKMKMKMECGRCQHQQSQSGKKVVVIGGGIAGGFLAKSLQFLADVTLIDRKEYFEIAWASLRSMVEPSFAERTVINHTEYFRNGRTVASTATNVTDTEVETEDGQSIPYDYLVIATGHSEPVPPTRRERLRQYEAENEKIKSSQSILIVGGGPTGVELAAEIAVDFPEKKVILVHSGSRLLEFIGQKASDKALEWLKSKKVEVYLEQRVDLNSIQDGKGSKLYRTSGGQTISADTHFICTGQRLGSAWLKNTILKDKVDSQGRLMVDENLRVKNCTNIFAIGDITDIPELKQGYVAEKHAAVAAKNLRLLINGGNEPKLTSYKPGYALAIVSLGRRDAVAEFPFTTIKGLIPGFIKSRDLFVGKTRKQLGLQPNTGN